MIDLQTELDQTSKRVADYILGSQFLRQLDPSHIADGTRLYTQRGGKMLRPAILLLACEAVGGDPKLALPAAAAIEMSHTWTLVHDDIIDNDDVRRNGPSVHAHYRAITAPLVSDPIRREHYARSLAMLVGDLQQAWAISLLNELSDQVDPKVFRFIIDRLTNYWVPKVMTGEALDVEYAERSLADVDEAMVLDMLFKKTASTFGFAGQAGAMIGLNRLEPDSPTVQIIQQVCLEAGMAFQIRDDILGIIGNASELGKPVGSDIREGKKTVIVAHAYRSASSAQRELLSKVLGDETADEHQVEQVRNILEEVGSLDYAAKVANEYADRARVALAKLDESRAKALFSQWIDFIVKRSK